MTDWGKRCFFRFNAEIDPETIIGQASAFAITDENGVTFRALECTLLDDYLTVQLEFLNFNNARGTCTASYTPGLLVTMAGKTVPYTEFVFLPINLVPTGSPPVAVAAFNQSPQGTDTFIVFDQPITSEDVFDDYTAFSFAFETREYAPDGAVVDKTVDAGYACYLLDVPLLPHTWGEVKDGGTWGDWDGGNHYVWGYDGYVPDEYMDFAYGEILHVVIPSGNTRSIQNALGDVTIFYDGSVTLAGDNGVVAAFTFSYTPENLIQKPDQMQTEHIEITDISAVGDLIRIYYHDAQETEHIEIINITAVGVLTDIGDL